MRSVSGTEPTSDIFAAIADPTRRKLLLRLAREGERSVTQLLEPFAISQPAVSKHLRVLREAGLVRRRKAGRENLYAIDVSRLRDVHDWVSQFEQYWDDKLDALGKLFGAKKKAKRRTT